MRGCTESINAAVHRSYLDHGNIQVAVYDNRLEITSPGKIDANAAKNCIDTAVDRDNKTADKLPGNCRKHAGKPPENHQKTVDK